jgi:hypothetical protein
MSEHNLAQPTQLDMNTLSISWELPVDWSAPEGLLVGKAAWSPTVNADNNGGCQPLSTPLSNKTNPFSALATDS